MTNRKSVKGALAASIMAIMLCVVMLVGTTFAWFTDTAASGVNKIQAGNLGIELVDKNGETVETLSFVNKEGSADILWEPGVTFHTNAFRVKNTGNLALKYKIEIDRDNVTGDKELLDVIDFSVVNAADVSRDSEAVDIDEFEGHLAANAAAEGMLCLQAHMDEAAGNTYQKMTLSGIKITVYATQDTVEEDSYDNQYDKDAKYTEITKTGKTFSSGSHTLTTGVIATEPNATAVKVTGNGTHVTIKDGTFDGGEGGNNLCVRVDTGATLTIDGGTFTVGKDASGTGNSVIIANGGDIVINGGFFRTDYAWRDFYYVLNQQNNNPGTITVTGGTFVNYDPSKGDDNLGGNFVPSGYHVETKTQANGDIWYTVVAD